MSEEVKVKVVALKDDNSFQSIEQDLKQLEKPRAAEFALNLSQAKRELQELKALQKEALKVEDFDLANKLGVQVELAAKKVTTLNRALTNFQRTGNENMSVLGKMFGSVESKMKQTFSGVMDQLGDTYVALEKVGKNTEGILMLKDRAEQLEKQLKSGEISIQKYTKGLEQIGGEVQGVLRTLQNGTGILGQFNGLLSKFGISAGSLLGGIGLSQAGQYLLNLGDKAEQASISFEVMLGSAEKSKKLLGDLSELAKQSSFFDLQGLRDSTKQLLAMGISQEQMIPTLKKLGDVAAGTGAPLSQLAYAYGQVATAGVATTQDMNQLINAGVPIWEELGKVVGKTVSEVKKMVERREISFDDVSKAFDNLTSDGGRFANMMEAQSKTLTGQWNAFKDTLNAIGEKIGLLLIPFAKKAIDMLNILVGGVAKIGEFFQSSIGKATAFGVVLLGLSGIIGAFVTGIWTLSGAFAALGLAKLKAAFSAQVLNGTLSATWALLSPFIAGIAIVAGVVGGLTLAWHSLKGALLGLGGAFQQLGEWLNIEPIKKFGEAISWAGEKVKQFGEWIGGGIKGIWNWVTGTDEATNSTKNLGNEVEIATQKVETWEKTIQKTEESLTGLQKATRDADDMFQNLQNSVNSLIEEKERLRAQFQNGEITIDEYNAKMAETDEKLQIAKQASDDFAKALEIVENNQLTYMERVAQMNTLNLNAGAYNVLIAKLREVAGEAYRALQLKAQLLDQAIKHPTTLDIATNLIPGVNTTKAVGRGVITGIDAFTDGKASKLFKEGQEKGMNFLKQKYQEVINKANETKNDLAQLGAESKKAQEEAKREAENAKNAKGSGGGGGKKGGGKAKESEEAKKAKKAEEDLQKARTKAYDEAKKKSEKYQEVIVSTNKKLAEQKKKLEEIRKEAEETMKDLDVKIFDNQLDFEEKIAKRYNEIIKELKDEIKDLGIVGLSDEAMISALEGGQFGGEQFAKWRDELEMIKEHVDAERLALALKNENLSETAKITYEYERQDRLLKNSLELQKAIKEGRYLTNANGGIDFLDENGNILKALERDQEKEFLEQAKKIQAIADEELKIFTEKNEKISEIEMSFQKERQEINEGYFEKDKELRLRQNAMSEEFYRQELERMGTLNGMVREVASGRMNNTTPLPMGEKSESHSNKAFREEEKGLEDRKDKNSKILGEYSDMVTTIEAGISAVTKAEIDKRLNMYRIEEQRLNDLIAKRMQAGYIIASVPRQFQNVSNVINHNPTISVNATSQGNLDANALANTLIKKVQNYYKGVN